MARVRDYLICASAVTAVAAMLALGLARLAQSSGVLCTADDPPGPTIAGAIPLYGCPVRR